MYVRLFIYQTNLASEYEMTDRPQTPLFDVMLEYRDGLFDQPFLIPRFPCQIDEIILLFK